MTKNTVNAFIVSLSRFFTDEMALEAKEASEVSGLPLADCIMAICAPRIQAFIEKHSTEIPKGKIEDFRWYLLKEAVNF